MAIQKNTLEDRLSRDSEITITVTGRKSGHAISRPIWFTWEEGKLYLLPVKGSDTQWYKNVLKNPVIRIDARGAKAELQVVVLADPKEVAPVIEKFREKYGPGDVKKYYSKFDVAVFAQTR